MSDKKSVSKEPDIYVFLESIFGIKFGTKKEHNRNSIGSYKWYKSLDLKSIYIEWKMKFI